MRFILAIISAVFAWLPEGGYAAEKCDVINALERIQFAQSRLAQVPLFPKAHQDAVLLADHLQRLDRDNIKNAVLPNATASEIVALQRYYENGVNLNTAVRAGQLDMVNAYFTRKSFRDAQFQIQTLLPRFGCNSALSQGTQGTSQKGQATAKITQSKVKISVKSAILWLLGTIALCAATGVGGVQYNNFLQSRKRRAKRFPAYIKTQIRLSHVFVDATMLDISGKGAKLQLHCDAEYDIGNRADLLLDDKWHKVQIIWQNTHYCGVNLWNRYPGRLFMHCASSHLRAERQKRKRRPHRDAVSKFSSQGKLIALR